MRTRSFDVVLLDVLMPGRSGADVLRELKADADLRDIPVLMISALDEMDTVIRCIELGAEDYLAKPFDAVLLRARVGRVPREEAAARPAGPSTCASWRSGTGSSSSACRNRSPRWSGSAASSASSRRRWPS